MINYLTLLFIFQFQAIKTNDEFYVFHFFYNNEPINNGYVHFLSNDELINEISAIGLNHNERDNKNCKIDKKGYYRINKEEFNNRYNKIGLDSINGIVRCDKGLGVLFNFKVSNDTIKILMENTSKESCFFTSSPKSP